MIENLKTTEKKFVTIKVEATSELEAYDIVSSVAFSHKVRSAKFDDREKEVFDKNHSPFNFMKGEKARKIFRDILGERKV